MPYFQKSVYFPAFFCSGGGILGKKQRGKQKTAEAVPERREVSAKTKKLSRLILFAAITLCAVFALYYGFVKFSGGKIDEISRHIVDSVKEKYGVEVGFEGMDIHFSVFLTNPEISLKKIEISCSGTKFAEMKECGISGFGSFLFSENKKIDVNCANTHFYAGNYRKLLGFIDKFKKDDVTGAKKEPGNEKIKKSFSFATEADIFFNENRFKFLIKSDVSSENGKIFLQENEEGRSGKTEITFSPASKKAVIRLDGMDLSSYREIIKNKTAFDIPSGNVNAVIDVEKSDSGIVLKNDITVKDLSFFHPVVDLHPFTIPLFRFSGEIAGNLGEKTVSTTDANISLGGIDAIFSGSYSKGSKEFTVKTKSVSLNKLETLIHDETFENYLFGGNLELFVSYSEKDDEQPVFSVTGNLIGPKQLSDRLDYLKGTFEYTFTNNDGIKRTIVVGERNPRFTPVSLVPDHLIWAIVVSEDAGFFVHQGIDFQELDAAVKDNIKNHKMRGGSTIPQQLAKNLFLSRDKTLLRKFREVLLAIELDATLSKERLLEIYLNIIEWAPGIFGISQAADYYFGKDPLELTPLESAYLASVIPGPSKYHYQFLTKNISENWYKSLFRILGIMNETGHLPRNEYFDALDQTLVFRENETSEF